MRIKDGCEAAGLVTTRARDRVTGARVVAQGGAEEILADLVIDATGRGARTPAWLSEMGYDPPTEERVRVDVITAWPTATGSWRGGSSEPPPRR